MQFGILIDEPAKWEVLSVMNKISVSHCLGLYSLAVIPAPEGSCWDCRTLGNANVCGLHAGKITLIRGAGWTE